MWGLYIPADPTTRKLVQSADLSLGHALCRPSSSYGADGPWGQVWNNATQTWIVGYQGPNPTIATCPSGQNIVGLKTAANSLGGFTYLQVGLAQAIE